MANTPDPDEVLTPSEQLPVTFFEAPVLAARRDDGRIYLNISDLCGAVVFVQHIGVVEDVSAQREHQPQRRQGREYEGDNAQHDGYQLALHSLHVHGSPFFSVRMGSGGF